MNKNNRTTYIERAGDNIRLSIRAIHFVSENGVNVAQVEWQIQDKASASIVNPHTQEPRQGKYVYERGTTNFNASVEPLMEDMIYAAKAVMEEYLTRKFGMKSEAMGEFNMDDNLFIDKLNELSGKSVKDDKQLNLFESTDSVEAKKDE